MGSAAVICRERNGGWRLIVPGTAYHDGWPLRPPAGDDSATLGRQAAVCLDRYGWQLAAWPECLPAGEFMVPLRRSPHGHRTDEAVRLLAAAGVSHASAHHAYIHAVAAAVRGHGIPAGDVSAGDGLPRSGFLRLGGALEDDFWDDADGGYRPSLCITWREDLGWFSHWSSLRAADYSRLPGISLAAVPGDVATAVLQIIPAAWPRRGVPRPAVWEARAGYDPDPALPRPGTTDISPALELALLAYARPGRLVPPGRQPDIVTAPETLRDEAQIFPSGAREGW